MQKRARKLVIIIVRVLLCAVFLTIACWGVSLHDQVTIVADDGSDATTIYRLVAEDDDSVTVWDAAGTQLEIPRGRIALDDSGNERIERGLLRALRASDLTIIGLAMLAFAPTVFLQSLRLKLMMRAQEIHISYRESLRLSFGGNFLNFVFMLGSTGGDVFKAYRVTQFTHKKTEAVTTILLDRVMGLTGLLIMAYLAIWLGSDDPLLRGLGVWSMWALVVLVVGAIFVSSNWATRLASGGFLSKIRGWAHVERMRASTERMVRHKTLLVACLLIAVVLQFAAVGTGVICAKALHMDFSGDRVWDYFAYVGSGHVVAAVPITVMGFGTMELAYKEFFLDSYGTLSQLLCLAIWVRVIPFIWSLPGAFFTLSASQRPHSMQEPGEQQ